MSIKTEILQALKPNSTLITMVDASGTDTTDVEQAVRFVATPSNIIVSLRDQKLVVSKPSVISLEQFEPTLKALRAVALSPVYNLDFEVKNIGAKNNPKDTTMANKSLDQITESLLGKLYGRTKTSYQKIGEAKIIYKHRVPVNEKHAASRTRNLKSIVIEYKGEKYAYPTIHVDGARALARHLSEGGIIGDLVSEHIVDTSKKFVRLREFVAYAKRNKLINESNEQTLELVKEKMLLIKEDFKRFAVTKQYEQMKQVFEQIRLAELSDDNVNSLKDQFTLKHFEQTLEEVLPLVNNILKEEELSNLSLQEEIVQGVYLTRSPSMSPALQFESAEAHLSYFVSETAKAVDSAKVQRFLNKVSRKIGEGRQLSIFEQDTLKTVMSNIKGKRVAETTTAGGIACAAGGPARDPMNPIKKLVDETNPDLLLADEEEITEWMPGDLGKDEWISRLREFLKLDCAPGTNRCRVRSGTAGSAKAMLRKDPELSKRYDLEFQDPSDVRVVIVDKAKQDSAIGRTTNAPEKPSDMVRPKVAMPKTDPSKWALESQILMENPSAEDHLKSLISDRCNLDQDEMLLIYSTEFQDDVLVVRFSTNKDYDGAEHLLILKNASCKESNGTYVGSVGEIQLNSERFGNCDFNGKLADFGTFVAALAEEGFIQCMQTEIAPAVAAIGGAALRGAATSAASHLVNKVIGDE